MAADELQLEEEITESDLPGPAIADEEDERTPEVTKGRLGDVYLPVSIELGTTQMMIQDILELDKGSIIELDRLAGETVDLLVNDKKFAEGEVVVIDEHFGIRITMLVTTAEVELLDR